MQNSEPAFKIVFGESWNNLPEVFIKRYSNLAYSNDVVSVTGKMEIHYSKWIAWMMPICRLLHLLAPYRVKDLPVTVDFCSDPTHHGVYLKRKFYINPIKPYEFNSCMQPLGKNDVVEVMPLRLGWRTHYFYESGKVIMQHKKYVICIGKYLLPLPLHWFLGKGYAEEVMVDENTYQMSMHMTHPWLGTLYRYSGTFTFVK